MISSAIFHLGMRRSDLSSIEDGEIYRKQGRHTAKEHLPLCPHIEVQDFRTSLVGRRFQLDDADEDNVLFYLSPRREKELDEENRRSALPNHWNGINPRLGPCCHRNFSWSLPARCGPSDRRTGIIRT